MAGTRFQVKTYGARLVSRRLLNMANMAEDMRPAWPAVTAVAARGIRNSFAKQGPGWAPLKPATIRSRIAEGYPPGPILTKSGRYRKAAVSPRPIGTASTLTLVIDVAYGEFHMTGTARMPARPIKISQYYQRMMATAIKVQLREAYIGG